MGDHIVVLSGAQMTTYYGPYTFDEASKVSVRFNTRAAQLGLSDYIEASVHKLNEASETLMRIVENHVHVD